MTRGASLTFDQVSKSYGAVMALQPTSMTVGQLLWCGRS